VAVVEISRLDAAGWAVARSLAEWARYVHGPLRVLAEQVECPCCDPFEARRMLEDAVAVLSPRTRRALRSKVEPLDEVYRQRTGLEVFGESDAPWWDRRF
jgi:hypothetical protein